MSWDSDGENQALCDEISEQRVARPKRSQTSREGLSTPASWEDATKLPGKAGHG